MPLGVQPICSNCSTNESQMWSKSSDGSIKCNKCWNETHLKDNNNGINDNKDSKDSDLKDKNEIAIDPQMDNNTNNNNNNNNSNKPNTTVVPKAPLIGIRKSVRCKGRIRTTFSNKLNTVKGKSRRIVFKRCVVRGPTAFATPVTSDYIFFKGKYYQIGDIVSLRDIDGGTYYAQIRGFLQDQYSEKSAVITWLLPSKESPLEYFDPSTYFLGPEEDIPRKLDFMEFVCHAPNDYYKSRFSPYPTLNMKVESGFIWTRIGPQIVKTSLKDKVIEESDQL